MNAKDFLKITKESYDVEIVTMIEEKIKKAAMDGKDQINIKVDDNFTSAVEMYFKDKGFTTFFSMFGGDQIISWAEEDFTNES